MDRGSVADLFERKRICVFGVLNTTPDSFSDGGRFSRDVGGPVDVAGAVVAAKDMIAAGAHVLDVGGESTRPGAREVPVSLEIDRTRPVIEALAQSVEVPLSIDTRKAAVAQAALSAGATIVNDVSGLAFDPALAEVAAAHDAWLVVGHMRGTPETMQDAPHYDDVLGEVTRELEAALDSARRAGVREARLAFDPGIGFGKRLADNHTLLANIGELKRRLGLPALVGPSRKRFLAELAGSDLDVRDRATHAACAIAVFAGADAVRVHDVPGVREAVAVGRALRDARLPSGDAGRT